MDHNDASTEISNVEIDKVTAEPPAKSNEVQPTDSILMAPLSVVQPITQAPRPNGASGPLGTDAKPIDAEATSPMRRDSPAEGGDSPPLSENENKSQPRIPDANGGAYTIWVTDKDGQLIDPPDDTNPDRIANPNRPDAVDIYYVVEGPPNPSPTTQQVELQLAVDKVLRACQRLYLKKAKPEPDKFRIYFVRLFRIAQLGLETHANPELANSVLASVTADLIDDEAAAMKNGHLIRLGRYALYYSILPLCIYLFSCLAPTWLLDSTLSRLNIDPPILASFAILWTGCFLGVWLSYGIRKTKISLADLTTADDDHLAPHIRLMFAGLLTMIIGILFTLGFIALDIGNISLTDIAGSPMLAFLIGLFCGISELALPASVGARAATFIQNIK